MTEKPSVSSFPSSLSPAEPSDFPRLLSTTCFFRDMVCNHLLKGFLSGIKAHGPANTPTAEHPQIYVVFPLATTKTVHSYFVIQLFFSATVIRTLNVVPSPSRLSTVMVPPCSSINCLETLRPRPDPLAFFFDVKNGR